ALRRAGAPYELTPGVLMSQTLVSSGTMTNRVDRLVAAGLVERHGHPGDRRVVVVRLTEPGVSAVDAAMSDLLAYESSLLAALEPQEREALTATLRELMRPFDA